MCFQPESFSLQPHARGLHVNQFCSIEEKPNGRIVGSLDGIGGVLNSRGNLVGLLGPFGEIQDKTAGELLRRYPWDH